MARGWGHLSVHPLVLSSQKSRVPQGGIRSLCSRCVSGKEWSENSVKNYFSINFVMLYSFQKRRLAVALSPTSVEGSHSPGCCAGKGVLFPPPSQLPGLRVQISVSAKLLPQLQPRPPTSHGHPASNTTCLRSTLLRFVEEIWIFACFRYFQTFYSDGEISVASGSGFEAPGAVMSGTCRLGIGSTVVSWEAGCDHKQWNEVGSGGP